MKTAAPASPSNDPSRSSSSSGALASHLYTTKLHTKVHTWTSGVAPRGPSFYDLHVSVYVCVCCMLGAPRTTFAYGTSGPHDPKRHTWPRRVHAPTAADTELR